MRWTIDFYNHRLGRVARYDIEAPSPAAALAAGQQARLAQYPAGGTPRRPTLFQRAERIGGEDGSGWVVYRITKLAIVVLLVASTSIAHADVPKPADIAACNEEAKEAIRRGKDARGASPNAEDQRRAADARKGDTSPGAPGARSPSGNPQLEGMDPARAGDAAYQAAYRTCMRKAGF
jgi:hypothetical protein